MRTWISEHGKEYDVPQEILSAGIPDISWHNDLCPCFGTQIGDTRVRLWVEHPLWVKRELGGPRFTVDRYDEQTSEYLAQHQTDDVNEAMRLYRVEVELASDREREQL